MANNEVLESIKRLGWSHIQLTKKGYRGAVQTYKSDEADLIPIMFYLDECFIVEDSQGLFRVQDLVAGLIKQKSINLEDTGYINGLSLVAYIDDTTKEVKYEDTLLTRLAINTQEVRYDIKRRLMAVNKLSESINIDISSFDVSSEG